MTGLFADAAAKVRKTKAAATPGPWTLVLRYSKKHPALVVGADFVTPLRTSGIPLKYPFTLADATWRALTNPAIGDPLANLLDLTEKFVAEYPELGAEHVDGEPCDDFACGLVTHIRDLARALLNEEAAHAG